MATLLELEQEILALPTLERERLATTAWESLFGAPGAADDPRVDPEGVRLAAERDREIDEGRVGAIDHAEFLRRTRGPVR